MNKLILGLLLLVSVQAKAGSRADLYSHCLLSAGATALVATVLEMRGMNRETAVLLGLTTALGAGMVKEFAMDAKADHRDMFVNGACAIGATIPLLSF